MGVILPYLLPFGILFISTFTRSALGFGDALIAMPLLAMAVGIRTAAPLVALIATTIALIILWRNWRVVDLQATWRIILASFLGIPLGLLLLKGISEQLMQAFLGVLIVVFSLYNYVKPRLEIRQEHMGLAYMFGFLAGVLGGAYNTVGPPIVVYGHLRRWPPERFRVTLQSCFLPACVLIVIGHGIAGLLTLRVLALYGISLPLVLIAIFLGAKLNASLTPEHFTRYVNFALFLIGVALCIQSLPF
jgi:hypothetical protein